MHKFHLGQAVGYRPAAGSWFRRLHAAPGAYVVTAKLPERDGEFAYRIRSADEQHERMVRESELTGLSRNEARPSGKAKR
jgi:hypothetical protein